MRTSFWQLIGLSHGGMVTTQNRLHHWFIQATAVPHQEECFTFCHTTENPYLTKADLQSALKKAQSKLGFVGEKDIILNLNYIGYMSEAEFGDNCGS